MSMRSLMCVLVTVLVHPPLLVYGQYGFNSYDVGQSFYVLAKDDVLEQTPKWCDDAPNPPLSARRALQLAEGRTNQLVKDRFGLVWELEYLTLHPCDNEFWFWIARFEARPTKGELPDVLPYLEVVVLMDGTVPPHRVSKDSWLTQEYIESFSSDADPSDSDVAGSNIVDLTAVRAKRLPKWNADDQNPPLSARRAMQLADKRKGRLVKDSVDWEWKREGLSLILRDDGHWVWESHYGQHVKGGGSSGPLPALSVFVLMDGSVLTEEEWERLR